MHHLLTSPMKKQIVNNFHKEGDFSITEDTLPQLLDSPRSRSRVLDIIHATNRADYTTMPRSTRLLSDAFERLRELPDLDLRPLTSNDMFLQITLESDEWFVGAYASFYAVYAYLKEAAHNHLQKHFPHLMKFHDKACIKLRLLRYKFNVSSAHYTQPEFCGVPHTENGTLALIFSDRPGLEVQDSRGNWWNAHTSETSPVVVYGRALAKMQAGAFASPHRVRTCPLNDACHAIVLLVEPNHDIFTS